MTDQLKSPSDNKPRKPRERNINLRQYYGIGSEPEESQRPFDIDSNTFDASRYFARKLKEKPLNALIAKDNALVGEIRGIDGDMKTLVYENYNKFISATDTIRKMKTNVESMESEMAHLTDNITSITEQTAEINKVLGPNREKIRRLTNVHNLLKRLQFMFELPNRLNHCLATENFNQAVKYHSKTTQILNHYQHMSVFKGIEKDFTAITDKIKDKIWERMRGSAATLNDVTESTRLLRLLGENPKKLWSSYIEIQTSHLVEMQKKTVNATSVDSIVDIYLIPLESITSNFENLFLQLGDVEAATGQELQLNEKAEAKDDLLRGINAFVDVFIKTATEYIRQLDSVDNEAGPLASIQNLNDLRAKIQELGPTLCRLTSISEWINDLTADWENRFVETMEKKTIEGVRERITTLKSFKMATLDDIKADGSALNTCLLETPAWLVKHLEQTYIQPLHDCVHAITLHSDSSFHTRVCKNFRGMWDAVLEVIQEAANTPDLEDKQLLPLIASRICIDISEHVVVKVYTHFIRVLWPKSNESNQAKDHGVSDEQLSSDAHEVMDTFSRTSQVLLNNHTMQEGFQLSTAIQAWYLQTDLVTENPRSVSSVWKTVLERLRYTEHFAENVCLQSPSPDGPNGGETSDGDYDYRFEEGYDGRFQSTQSLATTSSGDAAPTGLGIIPKFNYDSSINMMSNIDKLFADRVDVYRHIEPTAMGICGGLVRILLKAFHETVRQMALHTKHYQQLQIDVEYLRVSLWPYAQDNKWMSTVLQEIITSAITRCKSPVPLDLETLKQIAGHTEE